MTPLNIIYLKNIYIKIHICSYPIQGLLISLRGNTKLFTLYSPIFGIYPYMFTSDEAHATPCEALIGFFKI